MNTPNTQPDQPQLLSVPTPMGATYSTVDDDRAIPRVSKRLIALIAGGSVAATTAATSIAQAYSATPL